MTHSIEAGKKYFVHIDKIILKFICKSKEARIVVTVLKIKNAQVGATTCPECLTMWYWQRRDRKKNQRGSLRGALQDPQCVPLEIDGCGPQPQGGKWWPEKGQFGSHQSKDSSMSLQSHPEQQQGESNASSQELHERLQIPGQQD